MSRLILSPQKADQYHDESVSVLNKDTIQKISSLLKVKEKILEEALTQKKATAGGETVVMNYKMEDVSTGPEVIKLFLCSTQLGTKFQLLIKTKILTNKEVSCFNFLRCCIYYANKC